MRAGGLLITFKSTQNTYKSEYPRRLKLFSVPKSPRECEKWILYKILHRCSGPKKISTQNFSTKKIIFFQKQIFTIIVFVEQL